MNIITFSTIDVYWLQHLKRFEKLLMIAMPTAKLHVGLIASGELPSLELPELQFLKRHAVRYVPHRHTAGRLLAFDRARASSLEIFGLSEGLYSDVDVDILDDLSPIVSLYPDYRIIAPHEPVDLTELHEFDVVPPGAHQIGFMYLRQYSGDTRFSQLFDSVAANYSSQLPGMFMPGAYVWNHIMTTHAKTETLSTHWHSTLNMMPVPFNSAAIHYPTSVQRLRLYIRYSGKSPSRKIEFVNEPPYIDKFDGKDTGEEIL